MKKPISAEALFEEFVEQIETAVDAVATQVPYTRQHIVSIAFTMVENAGIYYDGVKEWRQKDTSDKMWEDFKTFFAREFREIRVHPSTSATEGYGTTNNMRGGHANDKEFERQQQQAEVLANLATALLLPVCLLPLPWPNLPALLPVVAVFKFRGVCMSSSHVVCCPKAFRH